MKRVILLCGIALCFSVETVQGRDALKDTLVGAATGAVIGQIIGRDTEATLTGAALGAVIGATDQKRHHHIEYWAGGSYYRQGHYDDVGYYSRHRWHPDPRPLQIIIPSCPSTNHLVSENNAQIEKAPAPENDNTRKITYFNGYFDDSDGYRGGHPYNPNNW